MRKKEKNDFSFKLVHNIGDRTCRALRAQSLKKRDKTFILLGCSNSFFENWIIHQLYGV